MRTTKICRTCAKELPISDFREGRRRCMRCEEKTYAENWASKTHITCNKCGVEKSIAEYYKGHKRCKECYSKDYKNKKPSYDEKKDYPGWPYFQLSLGSNGFLSVMFWVYKFGLCVDVLSRTWEWVYINEKST